MSDDDTGKNKSICFVTLGCIIIGVIIFIIVLLTGNSSSECEWDAADCSIDFPRVGYTCTKSYYEGNAVDCFYKVVQLGEDCYKGMFAYLCNCWFS